MEIICSHHILCQKVMPSRRDELGEFVTEVNDGILVCHIIRYGGNGNENIQIQPASLIHRSR